MKRYITVLAIAAAVLSSCADRLNQYPRSATSPDGVTSADLPALRYGAYSSMQTKTAVIGYICFDVLGGDITQRNYNPIDIYNNYMRTLGTNVTNQWNNFYSQLYDINNLLAAVERAGVEGNETIYGEGHYFRAMIYINLVTRWGGVPILRKNTMDRIPRDSEEDCWEFINEDLGIAVANLSQSSGPYMVSKDAAMALAARAYLYQGRMDKAAEYAEALITSGRYRLESDFSKIFGYLRRPDTETIFSFYMEDSEGGLNLGSQYFTYDYVHKGSGNYFPTAALYGLFSDSDKRLSTTFVMVGSDRCLGKYPGGQAHADPVIISRIAEMYLISAEAQGYPAGCSRLDELRDARGLGPANCYSKAELEEAVLLERRRELAGEGLIWYDYIRTDKAVERLGITRTQTKFPIPEREIRENPLLKQNPGWGGSEL